MNKPDLPAEGRHAEVFVSATSGDLRTVREIVTQALLTMGCFPVEQANFAPDYRSVRQMIEARIATCDAVVHIVGRRYGAEPDPATLPPGTPRRSYTQMEADIARQLGKRLYVFICPEDFPYDEEPDTESSEKRILQQAYRLQVAQDQALYTPIRDREEMAVKVRELQFQLEKVQGALARDRSRTYAMLGALAIILAVLAAGVWWSIEKTGSGFRYDRNLTRAALTTAIQDNAKKEIASLNPVEDWRKIKQIESEESQQLADLNHYLDSIEQILQKGEASESYLTATKILQEKGVAEALDFLESTSGERAASIEQQKNRLNSDEEEFHKLLRPELLQASLLEKQFRFADAEAKYREVVADAGGWAEPRNDLAMFLTKRGRVIDPTKGNAMLQEAVQICQGTLALNQKGNAPQDWAGTQNNLGIAYLDLGERSGGEEGNKELQQAVAAYQSALEVYTKADLPQDWAGTQNNLGIAYLELGERSGGEEGNKELQQAVAAYQSALEVRTKADLPQDWARTQNNLGSAYRNLGERSGGEEGNKELQQAVAAYQSALEVRTKADLPQDWAGTQNNLGNAYLDLGERSGGEEGNKELQQAVAAYQSALEVRTKADLPQDWAGTQNNLGNAYLDLVERSGGEEGNKELQQAVAAYQSALEVRTKADLPQDWAMTQNNLGSAYRNLGERSGGEEGNKELQQAVAAYQSALEVRTKADLPYDWAQTEKNLNSALAALAKAKGAEADPGPASSP